MQLRTSRVRLLPLIGKEQKQARTLAEHPKVLEGWARVPEPGSVAPGGAKHTHTHLVLRHVHR